MGDGRQKRTDSLRSMNARMRSLNVFERLRYAHPSREWIRPKSVWKMEMRSGGVRLRTGNGRCPV